MFPATKICSSYPQNEETSSDQDTQHPLQKAFPDYLSFMLSNLASELVQSHRPQRTLTSVAAAELAVQQLMKLHPQSVLTSAVAVVAVLAAAGLAAAIVHQT